MNTQTTQSKQEVLKGDRAVVFIEKAEEWLMDHKDYAHHEVRGMNDNELILELNLHYMGGFNQFIKDKGI